MKVSRLLPKAGSSDLVLPTALIRAIGADDFAACLMQAFAGPLPASHCTVFALQATGRAETVSSASAFGQTATLTAVEYMRQAFDRQDANMVWLRRRRPASEAKLWLSHQFEHEVANAEYRRVCYGEPGIRERLSLLAVLPDGYRVAVSFYRNHAMPDFLEQDSQWLRQHGVMTLAAVAQHVKVTRYERLSTPPRQAIMTQLSGRERELMSHLLAGRTTRDAAQWMGVAETTALTYRYRAFRRLGVATARELLARLDQGRVGE